MSKSTVRVVASVLMLILLACGATAYLAYHEVQEINKERATRIERVKEMQWQYITGVLREHQLQAKGEAEKIKRNIKGNITRNYGTDSASLSKDLASNNPSAPIFSITGHAVLDVYHAGIKNDNNDPFVATTSGIISDKSLNCSIGKASRTWDEEVQMHWNKKLAQAAVGALVVQKDGFIFWEFLPPDNSTHRALEVMSLDEMRGVFLSEGVDGLAGYEFLQAAYIDPKADMFGVPDVANNGLPMANNKFIVVQGFNLKDVLETYHSTQMQYFDNMQQQVIADTETRTETLTVGATMLCFVLFSCFGGVITAIRSKGGC